MVVSNSILRWANYGGMSFRSLYIHAKTSFTLEKIPPTLTPYLVVSLNSPLPYVVFHESLDWDLLIMLLC
jgi:hypothetical protein